ncbi:hypothetical protein FRB94_013694 [Tulasnella sp. JGI-2019a]|nr:hypothetical protein FRB94_013694 [Tulasnella sp. JGI-2019a]KAG9033511.1 hypothetical protein FRB95_014690 [Tulasnella sp. JGI-2019a]
MAYYVPHSQTTQAKAKIEGFQSNQSPPSPTQTFDPSSLFFNGPMFPDAFRNASANNQNAMDLDALMSLMPQNGDRGNAGKQGASNHQPGQQQQHNQHQQQQQHQHNQHSQQQRSGSLNLSIPPSVFEMSHFPGHLSSFQQHNNNSRDDTLESPQASQSIFGDTPTNSAHPGHLHNPFAGLPPSIPQYLQNGGGSIKTDSPVIGSPSDTSPFPTHASHARIHGHRSPSIGPNSHSRSRSRGGTSKPPPASRNGIKITGANTKRQSISSTSEEPQVYTPISSSSAASGRPQSIMIPSNNSHAQHPSHEFNSHQLSSLGPHPISPLGMHSTQTAPAWFVPSQQHNGQGHVEPGSYGIGANGGSDGAHTTPSFAQAFSSAAAVASQQLQPRSLSLGKSPKPGTSASASVLAGNLDVGSMAAMDSASKQAAILHEKRKRRRESHNAVERRRRDNINEKISELSTLLPDCLLDPSGATAGGSGTANLSSTVESLLPPSAGGTATTSAALSVGPEGDEKETPAMKANKGIILRKSVEYIRYLQQLVRIQANRNRELEAQLAHYNPDAMSSSSPNGSSPSNLLSAVGGMSVNGNGSDPLGMLHMINEDDMNGLVLSNMSNMSPEDTTSLAMMSGVSGSNSVGGLPRIGEDADADHTKNRTSPRSANGGSEEEEERGRVPFRGRRGYVNGGEVTNVSVGKGGVRDDSAELESAVSDGESRERMDE